MREFKTENIPAPKIGIKLKEGFSAYDLEIGAGSGMHAIRYANLYPTRYLVAIERTKNKFCRFEQQIKDHKKIDNLELIHGDAVNCLVHFKQQNIFSKIFIFYPNPEPKNKNQRWIHMPFFSFLWACLKHNGEIIMATNIEAYAKEFYEAAFTNWAIENRAIKKIDQNIQRSLFEKKYQVRGEKCWQVSLIKT